MWVMKLLKEDWCICSYICDWILENGSKSHIFISVYLSLQHEKYCILNNIS